jgi:hypothetical protein
MPLVKNKINVIIIWHIAIIFSFLLFPKEAIVGENPNYKMIDLKTMIKKSDFIITAVYIGDAMPLASAFKMKEILKIKKFRALSVVEGKVIVQWAGTGRGDFFLDPETGWPMEIDSGPTDAFFLDYEKEQQPIPGKEYIVFFKTVDEMVYNKYEYTAEGGYLDIERIDEVKKLIK